MPSEILRIPELEAMDGTSQVIRIAPETNIPMTERVRKIVDSPPFRRLCGVSQLGLVSLVYPSANHNRFEHSLGVYRLALLYLRRLANDARFVKHVSVKGAEKFILAALLHDIGHWPYCHPIEDIHLQDIPEHEAFAEIFINGDELSHLIREDWGIEPNDIANLLHGKAIDQESKILQSLLSGPIDIDKMDYLFRDSLHSGVPYGRNFDQARLIGSLCLNESADGLAITEKGKTAAELMVFARYVMFSEVYWHHSVRSATAMLQRAFYEVHASGQLDQQLICGFQDNEFQRWALELKSPESAKHLFSGIIGDQRKLYKRLAQYSIFEDAAIYEKLARRPFSWLVQCAAELAKLIEKETQTPCRPFDILFDAPPVHLEVQFNVDIYFEKQNHYRPFADVSPVVKTLAKEQFDDYVKRVRIFVNPELMDSVSKIENIDSLIEEAIRNVKS
jgi:HD superfamily phosphohydrolase